MLRRISFAGFIIIIYLCCSLNVYAQIGSNSKTNKLQPGSPTAQDRSGQENMRPVLSITPREIDLGSIKPGETVFGEFGLKNMIPQSMDWTASCPDGWEVSGGRALRGSVSGEPSYLHLELNVAESSDVLGDKPKTSVFRTGLKLESAGKEFVCQKDLKAGIHRLPFKVSSSGGQRTAYVGFRIHALQDTPSIHLNPQRLDLGVQLPGKILSKRIELTNRGREMLSWSVDASKSKPGERTDELSRERYISFHYDQLPEPGKYIIPEHLKESMELIGKWTEKNGYPMTKGGAGSLKFRFHGTGISVFLQSHTEEGNCSVYLDEIPVNLPDVLSGEWEKKELVIAEGLTDGPHVISIVVKEGSLELEGVKVFGKEIMRGPKGWITVFPNSGTTSTETDYINVKVDTSHLAPGYYSDQINFKSNAGEEKAEVFVDVASDTSTKIIDVYLYSKDLDHLFTSDPQADSKRLIQNGYIKEGIAFRLFAAQTPGTASFYRWYHPGLRDHFYHYDRTGGGKKLDGYVYEGIIGNIATSRMSNTRELYRWYNPSTRRHYYSTNPKAATGVRKGYRFDGIAGYVR
jgi:hypothetical protein